MIIDQKLVSGLHWCTTGHYNITEEWWGGIGHINQFTQFSSKMFIAGFPTAWGLDKHTNKR